MSVEINPRNYTNLNLIFSQFFARPNFAKPILLILRHPNSKKIRAKCIITAQNMLYTGKGDDGTTEIFGCDQQKISKSSEVPEALGALDELNAFLGFVKIQNAAEPRIASVLREIQENLFIIQAEVAGADKRLTQEAIGKMESMISDIEKEIPLIAGFSIAGGTELSALLDVARTLARRTERRLITVRDVMDKSDLSKLSGETIAYMNRLSSLLFALARLSNYLAGVKEENPHY